MDLQALAEGRPSGWDAYAIHVRLDDNLSQCFDPAPDYMDALVGTSYSVSEFASRLHSQIDARFQTRPPFTVQRLAELLLHPNQNYTRQAVYSYLSALSRVVSVATTADSYEPLDLAAEMSKSTTQDVATADIGWANGQSS